VTIRLAGPALVLAVLFSYVGLAGQPAAASGIEVRSQTTQNRFPNGIQFSILLSSDTEIQEIRLRYRVQPENLTSFARAECTPGSVTTCNAVVGGTTAIYLVPGAELIYAWEASNAAGDRLETAEQTVVYGDDRFRWQSQSLGNITAYFYSGSDRTIQTILETARQTIDEISALLRTEVDFPVKLWVYDTARDLQPAVASGRGLPPGAIGGVTLGEVAAPDTALVSRDRLALDTVRHELAHIVTRKAGRGHLGGIPTWVNEGISVYAQRELSPDQRGSLETAIRSNRPIPIESLSSRSGDVGLFYGQSGALVSHLIDKYGKDKFADFFGALRDNTLDQALRSVYGFDSLGLENDWRRAVGLPQVTRADAQGGSQQGIPTLVPFGAGGQQGGATTPVPAETDTRPQQASDGGSGISLVVILGVLTAVLVIGIVAAGLYVAKRTAA
jgi:hypothetical protein